MKNWIKLAVVGGVAVGTYLIYKHYSGRGRPTSTIKPRPINDGLNEEDKIENNRIPVNNTVCTDLTPIYTESTSVDEAIINSILPVEERDVSVGIDNKADDETGETSEIVTVVPSCTPFLPTTSQEENDVAVADDKTEETSAVAPVPTTVQAKEEIRQELEKLIENGSFGNMVGAQKVCNPTISLSNFFKDFLGVKSAIKQRIKEEEHHKTIYAGELLPRW